MIIILPREGSSYSHFNKELRQVFLAINSVWCRKSFPSLFEMTINAVIPAHYYQESNIQDIAGKG